MDSKTMGADDDPLMDAGLVFVQKMSSGEPVTRRRAFRTLCTWIKTESHEYEFGTDAMMRLCKGLHYVMWMQDKMLWQEQLADNISSLLTLFNSESQSVRFVKCMLWTLSNEWPRIDRWRMDKFLMLVRRIMRTLFSHLAVLEWQNEVVDLYFAAFKECVISTDKSFCDELKFHFASIYLDELDGAGGISQEKATFLLNPFVELLADRLLSDHLFSSVVDEVFMSIIHQYAEEMTAKSKASKKFKLSDNPGIKFNYLEIGNLLLETGKRPEVKSSRRRTLYDVAKKFKAVSVGINPIEMVSKEEVRMTNPITNKEINKAVSRLVNLEAQDQQRLQKSKLLTRKIKKREQDLAGAVLKKAKIKKTRKLGVLRRRIKKQQK